MAFSDVLHIARARRSRSGLIHFVEEKLHAVLDPGAFGIVVGKAFKYVQAQLAFWCDRPQHSGTLCTGSVFHSGMRIESQLPITQDESTFGQSPRTAIAHVAWVHVGTITEIQIICSHTSVLEHHILVS